MTFNYELAQRILDLGDRDTALFFTGRDEEIRQFESALRASALKEQAVFRIYQGAPGCGKTSLLARLREQPPDGVLFVEVEEEDLASLSALKSLAVRVAVEKGPFYAKLASEAVRAAGEVVRAKNTGHRASRSFETMVAKRVKTVVFYMDEAQTIGKTGYPEGLVALHRAGLHEGGSNIPTVCLLAGLSHTALNLGDVAGITRPARNATVSMGALSNDECVQSTRMMLNALNVTATVDEKAHMAETIAGMSFGWPHHLNGGQYALCEELVDVEGRLRDVDIERVRGASEENRHAYYLGRLTNSVLADNPQFSALLVAKACETRPPSKAALRQLCREERERSRWTDLPEPGSLATALIEKGAVTITMDGTCEVPIPSMAEWAAAIADGDPPRAMP